MSHKTIGLIAIIFSLVACNPVGPHLEVPTSGVHAKAVSYDQVRSVFAQNCAACHPSRSGPDWLDFSQAQRYALNGILERRVVTEKSMPPPGSPQSAAISDSDREKIALWVRSGAPEHAATASTPAGTDDAPEIGPKATALVQRCFQCHGPNGPGAFAEPKIPRLGGQHESYLESQLLAFKWRRRVDPSNEMNDMASTLSRAQIQEVAHYFSQQPGLCMDPSAPVADEARLQHGSKLANNYCISCHMNPGTSDPSVPLLAGQSEQYLTNQLIYFRAQNRHNPMMIEFTRTLSDNDIADLALFFSLRR